MKAFSYSILAAALFAAAPALAQPTSTGTEGKLEFAAMRSGTELSRYRTVLFAPLAVPQEVSYAVPPGGYPEEGPIHETTAGDVRRLQDAFSRSMDDVLWRKGLRVVTVPQNDTLIVVPQASEIVLSPRIDRGGYGIDYINVRSGGSVEMTAVLLDGTTRQPIGELADREYFVDLWGVDSRLIHWTNVGSVFDAWANDLSYTLKSH